MQDTIDSQTEDPIANPGLHARRGALYGYVATALEYPDESGLDDLRDDEVRTAVRTAAQELDDTVEAERGDDTPGSADGDPATVTLAERVRTLQSALEDAANDEIPPAYNALFGLPADDGTYPVVPYEAHYSTSGDVNETQRRIATIVGLLERFDLEPHDAFDDRQDHVAVLLELMQVIATQRAVALENDDREGAEALAAAETTVLDEHLQGFGPALAHDVTEATADVSERPGLDVYVAAADLAAALVRWDDALHPDAPVVDSGDPAGAAVGDASDSGAPGAPGENGGARR